jgi:hypothetical protein
MGYMRLHAIVVSSWSAPHIGDAHRKALELFDAPAEDNYRPIAPVSGILKSGVNGYESFFVGPDGSKEGWDRSDQGDAARAAFVAWLNKQRYEDGSTSLKWAEIQYGDEEGHNQMLHHDALRDRAEAESKRAGGRAEGEAGER